MSEQQSEPGEAPGASEPGNQQSRYLPSGLIQADEIKATNVANVQHIAEQHIHLPGQKYAPPLQLPRRAEHFRDRTAERAWLLAHLHPGQVVTVCGPGGMGKTALVAELLWTLAPDGTPPPSFPQGIVFHSFYGRPETAVALEQLARTFGEDPLPTPAQAAQRALSGKQVLLVLDGAEEAENLEQVLEVCASCAVLVTSRRRSDAADPALLLDLQRLPLDDAVTVVQAWQAQRGTNAAVIGRICQLVGGLPLALRLVGSYLALYPEEAEDYLAWLEEDVWQALDQGRTTHKSVPLLLARSVARVSAEAQTALGVIGLLALAPFERNLVTDVLQVATRAASKVLLELLDSGLLVQLGNAYEVSHPLIHTYARQVLLAHSDESRQQTLVERLVTVLVDHIPKVEYENWILCARCEQLVPHIQACALLIEQNGVVLKEAASLFTRAGSYLESRARYEQAESLFRQALTIEEKVLGSDHPYVADSLTFLANLHIHQGKYEQAEPLFRRALAIFEKVLGPDHLSTATGLSNLAFLYHFQGMHEQAEPLSRRALTIKEKVLGPDHLSTATSLDLLGWLYRAQGKYEQAEPLSRRALAIFEKVLGPDHPYTATSLRGLAIIYIFQGKYEQAEHLSWRALAICEKVLGPDHPYTAKTLNALAILNEQLNNFKQAELFYQRALPIYEKAFGPDHPETAIFLTNYAHLLRLIQRTEEATMFDRRAKAIRGRWL